MSSHFTVGDRRRGDGGASAGVLERLPVEDFPFIVWGPSPPFALGAVWAVCPSEAYAQAIKDALEACDAVADLAIERERTRLRKALTGGSR